MPDVRNNASLQITNSTMAEIIRDNVLSSKEQDKITPDECRRDFRKIAFDVSKEVEAELQDKDKSYKDLAEEQKVLYDRIRSKIGSFKHLTNHTIELETFEAFKELIDDFEKLTEYYDNIAELEISPNPDNQEIIIRFDDTFPLISKEREERLLKNGPGGGSGSSSNNAKKEEDKKEEKKPTAPLKLKLNFNISQSTQPTEDKEKDDEYDR
jgi:hypothetical protein